LILGVLAAVLLGLPAAAGGPSRTPAPSEAEVRAAYDAVRHGFFDLQERVAPRPEEVALGRDLFFDPRLSALGQLSCATCHHPGLSWTDGQPRALGLRRRPLERNTPSLLNVRRNLSKDFRWDGSAPTLEDAIRNAMTSRIEMRADPRAALASLLRLPGYARLFDRVYGPAGTTLDHAVSAIAAYVRADADQPGGPTPFDRYQTDPRALSAAQKRGLMLFTGKARCLLCHMGPFLSDDYYHATGLAADPRSDDVGRYAVDPSPAFWRAFKTAPLRGVEWSAPYMHDGRFRTLREVVDFYSRGGDDIQARDRQIQTLNLTDAEKEDLVAFLRSLSPPRRAVVPPELPAPEEPADAAAARARLASEVARERAYAARGDWTGAAAQAEVVSEDLPVLSRLAAAEGRPPDAGALAGADRAARALAAVDASSAAAREAAAPLAALEAAWARLAAPDGADGDVVPQPVRFPYAPRDPSWLYYRPGWEEAEVDAFRFPGRDAYPRVEDGAILPPKAYGAETKFSKADYERMKKALVVARRYADINAAYADGYRLEEKYGTGMGVHMHNLGYIFSGTLDVTKPQFLTYVRGRGNGRWQLIQLGYIHRGLERQKIFDSPDARGHFHHENICVQVLGGMLRDLPETEPCDGPGQRRLGPIWMMHFAVPIFNPRGIFADRFTYADRASRTGELHTFYGRSVP
jgi:cytochrome c peroxidase